MELTIRHLSGSRTGHTQKITTPSATVGRNPSNSIAFDPQADRAVSGNHAELHFRNGAWWIRDLGSSNGTWVNGERISERMIQSGEVVQLGTNGPQLQFDYDSVGPIIPDVPLSPGAPEGRTVMMMVGGGAPAAAAAAPGTPSAFAGPPPSYSAPKKKGSPLRAVLIVLFVFFLLGVLGIGALVFLRRGAAPPVATTQPAVDTAAQQEAAELQQKIEAAKAAMAETQQSIEQAQADPATTTDQQNTAELTDMQRQLLESQRLIDELTRQLQEKNDQANQPKVQPAQPQKRAGEVSDAENLRRVLALQAAQKAAQAQAAQKQPAANAPAQSAPASIIPVQAQQAAVQQAQPAPMNLTLNKKLRKRISVRGEQNDIPLPDLPDGGADDVARLIATSLNSMGDILATESGEDGAIAITITNFRDVKKTSVDTAAVGRTAGAIAGIAGASVPNTPADVRRGSRSSEISILVRAFDRGAVQLAQAQPSASASAAKTEFTLAGLALGQEAATGDSTLADVTRKVVADAIETLRERLDAIQWTGTITEHESGNPAIINCGSSCGIEVGDVFDVLQAGRPVGRVKVTFLDSQRATAQVISGTGAFAERTVRFAGRETESAIGNRQRSLQMRQKAAVFQGPGRSFRQVRELPAGARVRYLYSVGVWAKATDGSTSFWVPMKSAQVIQ
jgi:hypothetical protein